MWPWERKAYAKGFEDGRGRGMAESLSQHLTFGDPVADARKEADAECAAKLEAEYRRLGRLLWEARREIPDDSPMHARIREALDKGGSRDGVIERLEKMFPTAVKRR